MKPKLNLSEGELAEVKMAEDIAQTLDQNCEFEGLPFMDEMWQYCGRHFKVLKRVRRMTVEGVGVRYIRNTVILEGAECSGEAHSQCKRTCPILWKEAWLRRPNVRLNSQGTDREPIKAPSGHKCSNTSALRCQSASLVNASVSLPIWDPRRYKDDLKKGKIRPLLLSLSFLAQRLVARKNRIGLSTKRRRTPSVSLDLQPGELVEVRSVPEILVTLDSSGKNRGLEFTLEMQKYCGRRFRVMKRLDRMIIEKTGEMRQISNTVFLDGVTCDGESHGGCSRRCYCLWREIWLRRAG